MDKEEINNENSTLEPQNEETGCLPILLLILVLLILVVLGGNLAFAFANGFVHKCPRGGGVCSDVFWATDPLGFVLGISKDLIWLFLIAFLFFKYVKSGESNKK